MKTGMTLIEILIATSIGAMLAAAAAAVTLNVHRISARNLARLTLHDDASVIARTLDRSAQSCHPGGQWRLESSPGDDASWGTGDEWVSLTFLITPPARFDRTLGFGPEARSGTSWFRLRWDAAKAPERGRLRVSQGSALRNVETVRAGRTLTITQDSSPRRDRRRPLDDNDLRLVPGIDAATYTSLRMPGDGQDLDAYLVDVLAPSTSAEDFHLGWTDRAGRRIEWTAKTGLSVRNASGAAVSAPAGDAGWSANSIVLDGDFLDGRPHTLLGSPWSSGATRPLLLRLSVTLVESPRRDVPLSRGREIGQVFRFSFPLGAETFTP